jgi:hypothetical protein
VPSGGVKFQGRHDDDDAMFTEMDFVRRLQFEMD